MSVGEMKAALKDVPDDYEVVLDNAGVDECEIAEIHVGRLYPPALDHCGLIVIQQGQVITSDYDYHVRMDADHQLGHTLWWDSSKMEWKRPGA